MSNVADILKNVLPEKVLAPGREEYATSNGSYFTAFENEIRPAYIVQPASVQDVSKFVQELHPLLVTGDLLLAVRGGGHTPFEGSANIKDGVTIDMRGLKGVTLSEDKSIVTIGVGEDWTSVYRELEKHGLTTAGGRVGRVGVTGLVLGGGLSFYSTRCGFACDSIVDWEVVLASGKVVHATAQENSDLWTSLRGGLNNFGIVTSFKMKTFKSGLLWGGLTYYLPTAFPQMLQAACDFATTESDEDTHIMCSAGYGFGHRVATVVMYHTKGVENPPSLQRFTTLQPQIEQMKTMRTGTHLDFCNELSAFNKDGQRQFYATCTIRPDVDLMSAFHDRWEQALATLQTLDGFIFSFGFHPITKALLQNSAASGGNAKDIPPSDGPLFVVLLNPTWNRAEDDEKVITTVTRLLADFEELASEKGLLHRYKFTNYAYKTQDVFNGYGQESLARLKEVGRKYDPEGIFQKAVPGGFKLESSMT